ncbi:MAG: HAD-IIIA family hydrolase [Acidimicrobiales bacterium]
MTAAVAPEAVDIVIPTIGRPSLATLLAALSGCLSRVLVVDDRRSPSAPLELPRGIEVVRSGGRGPAAARNVGWRCRGAEWVAFLDDDVVPEPGWFDALRTDLAATGVDVGGSQGRVSVPLPRHRRPTDFERDVAGLGSADWITADMAYQRVALATVGGFDERFPRAYREDADLATRVRDAGWRLTKGSRTVTHPVPPAPWWISVARQAGNADDVVLRALYGRRWRERTGVPRGRRGRHLAVAAAAVGTVGALVAHRRRLAAASGALWFAGTAELAAARIAPGPADSREVAAMVATSVALPLAATTYWLAGWATLPARLRPRVVPPAAVLFDRDGTLVADVPYNGDPDLVVPTPSARRALRRLRAAGIPTAVVSNQSGVGQGLITEDQVEQVNRRIENLLGPVGPWFVCPHVADDHCGCRKPAPGLVLQAASALGVAPTDLAVVGDIGADVQAAQAAGARGILVPTAATRPEEVAAAPEVAADLDAAVRLLLGVR